jgi:gliding motility-associated-like protein
MVNTDSTVTINSLCKGTYDNFVAKTGGVCVSNSLGPVTLVDPPIIPAFDYNLHIHCNADTAFFTNLSSPAADLTYQWTFGDGSPISTLTNPVHEFTLSGSYITTLYITNTRCVDSTKKEIDITNLVKAGFTASPDSFTCTGKPVIFTNTSIGTSLHYLWNWGDGSLDSTRDAVHIYNHTGVYTVSMALSNYVPCRDTQTAVITVDSISAISISATDSAFCNGLSSTFTGIFAALGNTGYRWTFGDGQIIENVNPVSHSYENEKSYTVKLEAFYRACPDTSAMRTIAVFNHPPINIGADTSICPGGEAIMLADEINAKNSHASWRWSTGQTTPRIAVGSPGTYWVTVTIDGCTGTDSIEVKNDCYMDVPNAFTPNNDGINDYFLPRPRLAKGLTTFKMDIYNRWGQLVFSSENVEGRGWDGRMNGVDQPEGVYVYVIDATFRDGQMEHRQGNVTLMR